MRTRKLRISNAAGVLLALASLSGGLSLHSQKGPLITSDGERTGPSTSKPAEPAVSVVAALKPRPDSAAQARLAEVYGKQPLYFEPNQGQADRQVQFLSKGSGQTLFLTATDAMLVLQPSSARTFLRMKLVGANPQAKPAGLEELPGKVNYFIGNDPQKWRSNVPTFAKVRYGDVYPGVDLIYRGNQRQLEYDFVVAPGVDPSVIRLATSGARARRIDRNGDLVLKVQDGEIRFRKPTLYQPGADNKPPVTGRYVLRSHNQVGFKLAAYDVSKPLIIDPVVTYSTYLGGTVDFFGNQSETDGVGIAVDPNGSIYLAGSTNAIVGFPVFNAYRSSAPTPNYLANCPAGFTGNVFVAKVSATGVPVYITYLGGTHCNQGSGVAADANGNAYVTGWTESSDFPIAGSAFQASKPNAGGQTAFMSEFNANGGLAYSTYITAGRPGSVAVDSFGNVYLAGTADGSLFSAKTTPGAYRTTCATDDSYILELSPVNGVLPATPKYASCLASRSGGTLVAVDANGNLYLSGGVHAATDFVVKNGFQTSVAGNQDVFLAKLFPGGAGAADLLYSTFFGGTLDDEPNGIAVDSAGNAYVAGNTGSSDLPVTLTAIKPACLPVTFVDCAAFVAKFNTMAAGVPSLVFATYLGGSSGDDNAEGVAVDSSGNAFVAGFTASADFPTVDPIYACPGCASLQMNESMFVTEFSPAGSILFSTFLGGSLTDSDEAFSIALDSLGAIYLTGTAGSLNLPASNVPPIQPSMTGFFDAFVVRLSNNTPAGSNVAVQPLTLGKTPVSLTFSQVAAPGGDTTVGTSSTGPAPPENFQLGNPAVYYDISTTAVFSGSVTVCIDDTGIMFTGTPALFHFQNGMWVNVTTSVVGNIICGVVSALSPFALFQPTAGDTIPPTTVAAISPQPNAAGWNDTNVIVTLTAMDNVGGSGVADITYSLSGAQNLANMMVNGSSTMIPLSTEGLTTITYFATDNAGNIESPHALLVKIDKTAPNISGLRTPLPNAHGWNNTNVTVSFVCSDSLSGLGAGSPPPATVVSTEGFGQSVTGTCTDIAGNTASATVSNINIDKTPPAVTCDATPNVLWPPNHKLVNVNADVVVSDTLSGPAGFTLLSVTSNEPDSGLGDIQGWLIGGAGTSGQLRAERLGTGTGRVYTVAYQGIDEAGNTTNCSTAVLVPHDQGR